jgi:nucleoredoxin
MSQGLVDLLGAVLLTKDGEKDTASVLSGKQAVAIYFSAHWCPPCKAFTPQLAKWYNDSLAGKGMEIVFVSSDKDQSAFDEYYGEMPWKAVPFANKDVKQALDKKFKVQGIPTLVIVDGDGKLINKDGRAAVSKDPTGENFPWKPKSLFDILGAAKLIGKDGAEQSGATLKGKVFALYFSAHWCPPCRGFTPKLAEWYTNALKAKGLEVVFVSSDRDEGAFKEYFAEQPWLALDFSDRQAKEDLSSAFGVQGIPSLVIVDADGSTITKDGRAAVSGDPEGNDFPWHPKPVFNLKGGPGSIQEVPTVIAFCETNSAEQQASFEAAMTPCAAKFLAEAKAKDDDPDIGFAIATGSSGIVPQVRKLMSLSTLPPAKHEHPMELKEGGGGVVCDGCGQQISGDRFRCTAGCDFDFCNDCNTKSSGPVTEIPAKLMMLDIPDSGAFYEGPEGPITAEVVEKFVADYQAKALQRQQLQRG